MIRHRLLEDHESRRCNFSFAACICLMLAVTASGEQPPGELPIRPGNPDWPVAWTSYRIVRSLEEDIGDLIDHGVGVIPMHPASVQEARQAIELSRRTGIKFVIDLPEVTEHIGLVKTHGGTPIPALMIGGVYAGKAIDRHVFPFSAAKHEIIIEPPVYNQGFAYRRTIATAGKPDKEEDIAHYFPEMGPPIRAEVMVPLKPFDSQQHLKIIPATLAEAPSGIQPEIDSVTPDLSNSSETNGRNLYRMSFDLTGLDGAMLDHVGLAVYWSYAGSSQWFLFSGNVSAWAESTRRAIGTPVLNTLNRWIEANGGTFPLDVVLAARMGDECFYVTSHLNGPAVSYPLWDFSEPNLRAFRSRVGNVAYPRTWGFPEIYGPDAYAWWHYIFHEGCAQLLGIARDQIAKVAPGLLLFRNTTRMGVFHPSNDRDGTGQELLARYLDVVHLDPYPVNSQGYRRNITRDMSYCAGLARRYDRILLPWMQAHVYGTLNHVAPAEVDRMCAEQYAQGPDAIMWLGYGGTFPVVRPDSWERAATFHRKLKSSPPPKPAARLAVLRGYRAWSLSHRMDGKIRNPADWLLQQLLEVWAVQHGQPYDVVELPPAPADAERRVLERRVRNYDYVVATEPWAGAWVIGSGTVGTTMDPATAPAVQRRFQRELIARGWLKGR